MSAAVPPATPAAAAPGRFRHGHAVHPNWRMVTELCLAQIDAQSRSPAYARRASLGFAYLGDPLAPYASEILAFLRVRTGVPDWVGSVGIGVCAPGMGYFDEPALSVMLADLPADAFSVFSGTRPLPLPDARTPSGAIAAHTALVHADPAAPDLPGLIADMARRVECNWLFGGVTSSRGPGVQLANETQAGGGHASNVYGSGLSGVVFSSEVHLASRVAQASAPLAGPHAVTRSEGSVVFELDGRPALAVLLADLDADEPMTLMRHPRLAHGLFVGLQLPGAAPHDMLLRNVLAVDPREGSIALAGAIEPGRRLLFCTRDGVSAALDLRRACAELRDDIESDAPALALEAPRAPGALDARKRIRGALYISCVARPGQLFADPSQELAIIREGLGDIPLTGFFANGEIARDQLHTHTGVLTLFVG
ncbi:FIST signal transduction protein [Derxia lacustris]|uniref:FIST signal transduction protein n=1 Tax=Derxia lacustris TaxID=764842 RepID=UPI001592C9EA|nr:FIST C-terminal domain-containing protein [Derxia lacustris]